MARGCTTDMVPDEPPFEAILFLIDGSGSIKAPDFERVTLFFFVLECTHSTVN